MALAVAAHRRLITTAERVDDGRRGAPAGPGWTVGHVLAHLARNADGHTRRLEGALKGREVARYPAVTRSARARSRPGPAGRSRS